MSTESKLLEAVPAGSLAYTEPGITWLEDHPEFFGVIDDFNRTLFNPPSVLSGRDYLGDGKNSVVKGYEDAAVKIACPITLDHERGEIFRKPENLLMQFNFLNSLGSYLTDHPETGVIVPQQYLAYQARKHISMKVEQQMIGWLSLYEHTTPFDLLRIRQATSVVKERILDLGLPRQYKAGLQDLGLKPRHLLNTRNILVPKGTEDLSDAQLCIIDQAPSGFIGNVVLRTLSLH